MTTYTTDLPDYVIDMLSEISQDDMRTESRMLEYLIVKKHESMFGPSEFVWEHRLLPCGTDEFLKVRVIV